MLKYERSREEGKTRGRLGVDEGENGWKRRGQEKGEEAMRRSLREDEGEGVKEGRGREDKKREEREWRMSFWNVAV